MHAGMSALSRDFGKDCHGPEDTQDRHEFFPITKSLIARR